MKKTIVITWIACTTVAMACKTSHDSVERAEEQSEAKGTVAEEVSDFLIEAIDARTMNLAQGKLAIERGTTPDIKQYGELMIRDQTRLLNEIKALAASKGITLPPTLSEENTDGLEDLKEEQGKDFDKEFISMMILDHKRDIQEFEEAKTFDDGDIRTFAANYLPMIQSHLEKIRKIKEDHSRR